MKAHCRALVVAALTAAFALSGAAARDLSIETDTDRPGADYAVSILEAADPELCRSRCRADAQCSAFTYVKPGVQGPEPRCFLKKSAPPPQAASCCVSGIRSPDTPLPPAPAPRATMEVGADRPGSDYSAATLFGPDPTLCRTQCDRDLRCRAFTYVKPGLHGPEARCYLKDQIPPAIASVCCVSGIAVYHPDEPLRTDVAEFAAVWRPASDRADIYWIDRVGAVASVWKEKNRGWRAEYQASPPAAARPGQPLAAVASDGEHVAVLWADAAGIVHVVDRDPFNPEWSVPRAITGVGAAPPYAPLATVWQERGDELQVYWMASGVGIRGLRKPRGGEWTDMGLVLALRGAPAGGRLAAVSNPARETIELFWGGGGVKQAVKPWDALSATELNTLAPSSNIKDGAPIQAIYAPFERSVEVYWSRADGMIRGVRRPAASTWSAPFDVQLSGVVGGTVPLAVVSEPVSGAVHVYWPKQSGALMRSTRLPPCPAGNCWSLPEEAAPASAVFPSLPLAALWQPAYRQYEIFGVGADGRAVRTVAAKALPSAVATGVSAKTASSGAGFRMEALWIGPDRSLLYSWKPAGDELDTGDRPYAKAWRQPVAVSHADVGVRGAPVTYIWDRQVAVYLFTTSATGDVLFADRRFDTINAVTGERAPWMGARSIGGGRNTIAGAAISAVLASTDGNVELFWSSTHGSVVSTQHVDNNFSVVTPITANGVAPPGAQISAVVQPGGARTDLLWIDTTGAVNWMWRDGGAWSAPTKLTPVRSAVPGSPLAVTWDPAAWSGNVALMASWVDADRVLNSLTRVGSSAWEHRTHRTLGDFPPGVPMTPLAWPDRAELAWTDEDGALRIFSRPFGKTWQTVDAPNVAKGVSQFMAPLGTGWDPVAKRVDLTGVGTDAGVQTAWRVVSEGWNPYVTQPLHRIALARSEQPMNAARCMNFMATGLDLDPPDPVKWITCSELLGLTAFCAKSSTYPIRRWTTVDGLVRGVATCSDPVIPDPDVLEEMRMIAEGVRDGLVTALPYIALGMQGFACTTGQVYACVTVAAQAASLADIEALGIDAPTLASAIATAGYISGCAGGDITQCVQVGLRAAAPAAKTVVPGVSLDLVLALAGPCADGDFAACARLGALATAAAGDPLGLSELATLDYRACLEGDAGACLELGEKVATLTGLVDLEEFTDGAQLAADCANGDNEACTELGLKAAEAAGMPSLPFRIETVRTAVACAANEQAQCELLGREVARTGFPLVGVPGAVELAALCVTDAAACADLGETVAPLMKP